MTRKADRPDDRALAREALRRAAAGREPAMERLLGAVPEMLQEARRRRLTASRDPVGAFVPLALSAIPRLATATALLLLISIALFVFGPAETRTADSSFESLLLSGDELSGGVDPFYEAILGQESGDG